MVSLTHWWQKSPTLSLSPFRFLAATVDQWDPWLDTWTGWLELDISFWLGTFIFGSLLEGCTTEFLSLIIDSFYWERFLYIIGSGRRWKSTRATLGHYGTLWDIWDTISCVPASFLTFPLLLLRASPHEHMISLWTWTFRFLSDWDPTSVHARKGSRCTFRCAGSSSVFSQSVIHGN